MIEKKYYNISDEDSIMMSGDEIRAHATGAKIRYCGLSTVFRVAYNRKGWVTAVDDSGLIIQGWAGEFCAA